MSNDRPSGPYSPTSPEQYLEDTLYNFQAVREIADRQLEWALFEDRIQDDCSVFVDQRTGNRIVITELPFDPVDFLGATVQIRNVENPPMISWGEEIIEECELLFQISSNFQPFLKNPRNGKWLAGDAEQLAHMLDMPQTKPYPHSEYDSRVQPPIIEPELPELDTPRTLHQFYEIQQNADLLRIPSGRLYTYLCSRFDEIVSQEDCVPEPIISAEGFMGGKRRTGLYRVLAEEVDAADSIGDILDVEDFNREFEVTLLPLSGPISMSTRMLGSDEFVSHTDTEFEFTLTREGLRQYIKKDGREYLFAPHEDVMKALYVAFVTAEF